MPFLYDRAVRKLGIIPKHRVAIRRNVKVRMEDGVELLTDLYFGSPDARAPAIIVRSPYGKGMHIATSTAYPLATQGFNVVLQCCRGTGGSSGTFDPHHDEQRDGLATIEWVKQQSWCDGRIATTGGSYLGYTQWAVSAAAGPEVKAMAMQITLSDFSQMTYAGGSLMLQNAFTWTYMVTMMRRPLSILRLVLARMRGQPMVPTDTWRLLPLKTLDEKATGAAVPFWRDWMRHCSAHEPWWSSMNHHKTIPQLKRPITMVAGWFDIFTPWQMRDFSALQRAGCEVRITVGPWQHTDQGVIEAGLSDTLEWFNQHLFDRQPAAPRKPVRLYVIGANEWRDFDAWPPRESMAEHWYLQPHRQLATHLPPDSAADDYRYDPSDPTPSIGGPSLEGADSCVDNGVLESRADVITYTSEPFVQPRDVIGTVAVELYVTSSAASADFFVRLCDVDSAGVSKNICDGLQRVLVERSGKPQQVRFELWPTAYRMAAGHRLRVQISSGAFPRWARNPGGTEPLPDAANVLAATQTIHHSPMFPSSVIMPFV